MTGTLDQVGMGDVHAACGESEFTCLGIGSGVVLTAFDASSKVGACAHVLLPVAPPDFDRNRPGKYVDTGFAEVFRIMQLIGADPGNIRVAIVGGASLMSCTDSSMYDLGVRNLEAAHLALAELGFICVAQEVGGQVGRAVSMSTVSGAVRVRTSILQDKVICTLKG